MVASNLAITRRPHYGNQYFSAIVIILVFPILFQFGSSRNDLKPSPPNVDRCNRGKIHRESVGKYEAWNLEMPASGRAEIYLKKDDNHDFSIRVLDPNNPKSGLLRTESVVQYKTDKSDPARKHYFCIIAEKEAKFIVFVERLKRGEIDEYCLAYDFTSNDDIQEHTTNVLLHKDCEPLNNSTITNSLSALDSADSWSFILPEMSSFNIAFRPHNADSKLHAFLYYQGEMKGEIASISQSIDSVLATKFDVKVMADSKLDFPALYSLQIEFKNCGPSITVLEQEQTVFDKFEEKEMAQWFKFVTPNFDWGGNLVVKVDQNDLRILIHTDDPLKVLNQNLEENQSEIKFPVLSSKTFYLELANIYRRETDFSIEAKYEPTRISELLGEINSLKTQVFSLEKQANEARQNARQSDSTKNIQLRAGLKKTRTYLYGLALDLAKKLSDSQAGVPSDEIEKCFKMAIELNQNQKNEEPFFERARYREQIWLRNRNSDNSRREHLKLSIADYEECKKRNPKNVEAQKKLDELRPALESER